MKSLKGRSFLKIVDFTAEEINYLIQLSRILKRQRKSGVGDKPLVGKAVVLIFQKDSTRTRCAFEVGAAELGMTTVYIGPSGSQFGKKESVEDSAKVLGRMFAGIQFRGYQQSDIEILGRYAGVPVWNGLTDEWHPTQMIADFMTMQEHFGKDLKHKKLVYVGDARNNVARSLMVTAAKLGLDYVALAPSGLMPAPDLVKKCQAFARQSGGSIKLETDWRVATKNADVIYTDVWVSMGENDWTERLALLHNYQVNMAMINNAHPNMIFMHCLPAFHGMGTIIGAKKAKEYGTKFPKVANGEFEVTDAVMRSKHAVVFDQAENRLHSIKAIMLATL